MLERILENWLTNLNERGYEIPFAQLLSAEGFRVIHGPVHHPFEHGKDILAVAENGQIYAFQLKGGNIDLEEFETIQGQLLALCGTAVTYPGIEPPRRPDRVALVTNGTLTPPARGRLEAFNHSNRHLGLTILECIEKEHLIGRFRDAHQQYLPSDPRDLNKFLNLYLSDGCGPFPVERFLEFINALMAPALETGSASKIRRALGSAVLFTAYTASPWERSENHVGIAEAWLSCCIAVLHAASELGLSEDVWLTSYDLSFESSRLALGRLLSAALSSEDLVIPDLTEGLVYPIRALIVSGYLAAFLISESIIPHGENISSRVREILLREVPFVGSPGEAGAPFVFNIIAALEATGRVEDSIKLLVKWANTLIALNSPNSESALPDPYHRFDEILMASLQEQDLGERFDGQAYTLHVAIDWLARRGLRPIVEKYWPPLTHIALCEFRCSTPSKILSMNDDAGQLLTWQPATPESWLRLHEASSSVQESDLPMDLWRHAEMIPYLGLLLPFRFTSMIAKSLDYLATGTCKVSFADEENDSQSRADA